MVRERGLEPPPPKGLPPQGSASTNSATRARGLAFCLSLARWQGDSCNAVWD